MSLKLIREKYGVTGLSGVESSFTQRIQHAPDQFSLDVAPEENFLEVIKDPISVQAVIGCRETSPGNGTDKVDFVQQPLGPLLGFNIGVQDYNHHHTTLEVTHRVDLKQKY